ncbi:hypothetical protein GGU11DRAFT_808572, partial [Lentinula aff. detonsa]
MLTGDGLENEHIKVDSALIPCLLPFTCQNHSWTCPQHPRTFPTANRSKIDCYAHHPIELPVANESRNGLVCSCSPTRYTPATHPTENKSIHTYATLRPTHKTSPVWTRLRSLTLRPTHTHSPYAGQKTSPTRTRFLLFTLRPTPTLRPTNKTSPLWTRLRSFIYAQPPRRTENESALDSFSGVHPMPDPHATPSPYAQPTRYARLTKRVCFGLVCGRSSTPNPHAGQKTSPRWTRFLAFTLHPTHTLRPTDKTSPLWTRLRSFTLRPTHTPDRKRVRVGLVFCCSPYAQPTRYARPTKRVRFGLVCGRSPYAQPTRRTENESALDSFSGRRLPTYYAPPTCPTANESNADSFAAIHPLATPHPLAQQHTCVLHPTEASDPCSCAHHPKD